MKFRWPIWSDKCYDCGHVTRGLWLPWYTPHPVTPQQEFISTVLESAQANKMFSQIIQMSDGEFKTFLEAGTNPTLDMHIPPLKAETYESVTGVIERFEAANSG